MITKVHKLEMAAQKLDQLLQEAALYAVRHNVGWDRVEELQRLYRSYQDALDNVRESRVPVEPSRRLAA